MRVDVLSAQPVLGLTRPTCMRGTARFILVSLCAVALSGCTGGGLKQVAPAASSHPPPKAQLDLRLLHHVERIFYCDPDLYPVGYGTRAQAADRGFPRARRDAEAFQAILTDLRIAPTRLYTLPTKERVWGLYKRMNARSATHQGRLQVRHHPFAHGRDAGGPEAPARFR
jgi:hypothetical protein